MTAAIATRPMRPTPAARPARPIRFRPVVTEPSDVRRPASRSCRPSTLAAVPSARELAIGVLVVLVAVVGLRVLTPADATVPAASSASGELVITVGDGETLDDVLERVADGSARIDLGEQIVRLNGGRDLQPGRQFVVRLG